MSQETDKEEIEDLKDQIENLELKIENLNDDENTEQYNEFLDECYGKFTIGVCEFWASNILKELDEIAYRTGRSEYYDEELSELEVKVDELKEELKELESPS